MYQFLEAIIKKEATEHTGRGQGGNRTSARAPPLSPRYPERMHKGSAGMKGTDA